MIYCFKDLLISLDYDASGWSFVVPRAPLTGRSKAPAEVPLQVTIPKRVKRALDLKSVETGQTRRALVLQALRELGVTVSDDDIVGRRGTKKS